MTEAEKNAAIEELKRKQAGWDYLAEERKQSIRDTVTREALPALQSSFAYAQTLPPRLESGLVTFYAVLGRQTNQCSIS